MVVMDAPVVGVSRVRVGVGGAAVPGSVSRRMIRQGGGDDQEREDENLKTFG